MGKLKNGNYLTALQNFLKLMLYNLFSI